MGDVAGVDYVLHQAAWGCAPCKALDKDIEPVFGPDRAGDYGGYWVVSIRHRTDIMRYSRKLRVCNDPAGIVIRV